MRAANVAIIALTMCLCSAWAVESLPPAIPGVVSTQERAVGELGQYLTTADWHKRIKIEQAIGSDELIASRIFRAFDVIRVGKLPRDDPLEADAAWKELLRNPTLTVCVLRPILFESVTREDQARMSSMSYPPVSDNNREVVYSVFRRIAAFEVTTNAIHTLQGLSRISNQEIAEGANRNLVLALKQNWREQKLLYFTTHSGDILKWFADNVLRKGLRRQDIDMYLGKGAEGPDFSIQYYGKQAEQTIALKLRFWDDYLVGWKVEPTVGTGRQK